MDHLVTCCKLVYIKTPSHDPFFKDPILGSENWKQAFRRSDFEVPFLW